MSNIYIQEPPSNGKVSAIKISFHRVVPEFIVQGGDPTGTWTVESPIYGRQFKVNLHCLVAMANAGPHDNGSQFFFTLGRADELNNKHTIFGKVKRDTMYNMLRLAEVECDQEERHLNPHKLRTTDVLHSPFDDIIPQEAEEEEEMVTQVSQTLKGKSKSSHDLLKDDPLLSSVPTVNKSGEDDEAAEGDADGDEKEYDSEREEMSERISKKMEEKKSTDPSEEDRGKRTNRRLITQK
uniref:Peptidyl-prolyl cis-trans isomerase n=1 Tax=Oncorhynchus tshawytscha TaxID=74940 RepID=A0A8C8CKH2_ONCTS